MITKIPIFLSVVLSLLSAFMYLNYRIEIIQKENIILTDKNTKLKQAFQEQKNTTTLLKNTVDSSIILNNNLTKGFVSVEEQKQEVNQKLNSYRGRLYNATLKKPKIIERIANKSLLTILHQFSKESRSKDNTSKD